MGEVWFGTEKAKAMINWVHENVPKETEIVDLGCGNGHLIFELLSLGFHNVLGVDYSERSIELCREIAAQSEMGNLARFKVMDILEESHYLELPEVGLLMDKGTFDAISLAPFDKEPSPSNRYVNAVNAILGKGKYFIITSCNWTKQELLARFSEFTLLDKINHPTFTFGGVKGETVTTIILIKN
jgi:EEF1A lysine methyltransferase 2